MDNLLRASEVRKLLIANGDMTITKTSFAELVTNGKIPIADKVGVKNRKMFIYEEVKEALFLGGYGKPKQKENSNLENIPDPEEGQSKEDYIKTIEDRLKKKPTLTDANILKTIYDTRTKKFDFDTKQGLHVLKSDMENTAFNASRVIRDKLLTIPERLSNELATINEPHTIKELLYKEINILLDGFSADSFDVK